MSDGSFESEFENRQVGGVAGLKVFFIKVCIVFGFVLALLFFLMPSSETLKRMERREDYKLIAVSFIQNPRTLLELSRLEESKRRYDNAVRYQQAAVGLIEMHNGNMEVLREYRDRLIFLESTRKTDTK